MWGERTLAIGQLWMTSCKWKPLLLREKYIECLAATISEKNFRSDFELLGMHRIKAPSWEGSCIKQKLRSETMPGHNLKRKSNYCFLTVDDCQVNPRLDKEVESPDKDGRLTNVWSSAGRLAGRPSPLQSIPNLPSLKLKVLLSSPLHTAMRVSLKGLFRALKFKRNFYRSLCIVFVFVWIYP